MTNAMAGQGKGRRRVWAIAMTVQGGCKSNNNGHKLVYVGQAEVEGSKEERRIKAASGQGGACRPGGHGGHSCRPS